MAHDIRFRLDPTAAPSDAAERVETWRSQFRPILPDRGTDYRTVDARGDGTRPAYAECRQLFDCRDDRAAILADLTETAFPDASWFVVHARRNDAELADSDYADDPDYYPPGQTNGLRAPVTMHRSGRFGVDYDAIHYLIDGTRHTVSAGTYRFDPPERDPEAVDLYADADETLGTGGSVHVATVTVHPGKIVDIDTASVPQTTEEWGAPDLTRGEPPTPLVDDSDSFPDPVPVNDRIAQLEAAAGVRGPGQGGIAHRIDDLESRVETLEGNH